jgi:hypothetical protein
MTHSMMEGGLAVAVSDVYVSMISKKKVDSKKRASICGNV